MRLSCCFIGTLSQTLTLRAFVSIPSIPLTPFSRGHIRPPCAPERMAAASLFFGRHLRMPYLIPPHPPFQGGRSGPAGFPSPRCLPCPPAPARHLKMPASPSEERAKELRGFLLPYTPGASCNYLMLRGLTDFRVVKIATLKSNKSLIISVLWVAPL